MTPDWFTKAVSAPCESRFVNVDGTSIHYLAWNIDERDKPGLLFAHGFRAHARWWSLIAPFFLSRFRVVALDFAGMGDSGPRAEYSDRAFSRDILGVLEHSGLGRSTLVGHSFGGARVAVTSADFPECTNRTIIIDSNIPVPYDKQRPMKPPELRPKKIYPTYEAARQRFRLIPEQNCAASYVLDYVGEHSLKQVDGGWTWKFDDTLIQRRLTRTPEEAAVMLARIQVPTTFIYGDQSIVASRDLAHAIVRCLKHGRGPVAVPQSHHHVLLDQPLALIAALKAVLY